MPVTWGPQRLEEWTSPSCKCLGIEISTQQHYKITARGQQALSSNKKPPSAAVLLTLWSVLSQPIVLHTFEHSKQPKLRPEGQRCCPLHVRPSRSLRLWFPVNFLGQGCECKSSGFQIRWTAKMWRERLRMWGKCAFSYAGVWAVPRLYSFIYSS